MLLRPAASQQADWRPFALGLAAAGLVGAVLAAAIAFLLARGVARPVARVSAASRALASGEAPRPLPVAGPTELATLASSFNHLAEELRRTQDAERSFLVSVSHELKTPLTAIRGHAEALQDAVLEPAPTGVVIEREARRLERLVGDLLDLARLRRRAFSVRAEPIDLEDAALAAFQRHEPAARAFGVELQVLAEPDAVAIGDADRLLQALSNLVENALRSTPRGGTVRIVARPGRVEVVDDGPGLATDDLGRAFERFYLYDRYAGERRVGTGLGLAIVRELVEAMGGSTGVRSELGAGATFSIALPLAAGARIGRGRASGLRPGRPVRARLTAFERLGSADGGRARHRGRPGGRREPHGRDPGGGGRSRRSHRPLRRVDAPSRVRARRGAAAGLGRRRRLARRRALRPVGRRPRERAPRPRVAHRARPDAPHAPSRRHHVVARARGRGVRRGPRRGRARPRAAGDRAGRAHGARSTPTSRRSTRRQRAPSPRRPGSSRGSTA